MRTALNRRARPATASGPIRFAPIDAAPAPRVAQPAPMHDISGVAIGESVQRKSSTGGNAEAYRAPNRTGLPDRLKAGVEARSGLSLDRVRVHSNSEQPAQLNAHAFTRGTDIHVAPGQERHLAHEAWHVVQQAQGRVRPTMQTLSGIGINDNPALEAEANRFQTGLDSIGGPAPAGNDVPVAQPTSAGVVQRNVKVGDDTYELGDENGRNLDDLMAAIKREATAKSVFLKPGWAKVIRQKMGKNAGLTEYTSWDEALAELSKGPKAAYANRKRKLEQQSATITRLTTGVDPDTVKAGRILSYESRKSLESIRKQMARTAEVKATVDELEKLKENIDTTVNTEVTTKNMAILFEALLQTKNMQRRYINVHGVSIDVHGYGNPNISLSTMKVGGPNVGSYEQILKAGKDIRNESGMLKVLEMLRYAPTALGVSLNFDAYLKGGPLSNLFASDRPTSSFQYLSAVSGANLNNPNYQALREQQSNSNAHTVKEHDPVFFEALRRYMLNPTIELKTGLRKKSKLTLADSLEAKEYDPDLDVSDVDEKHYQPNFVRKKTNKNRKKKPDEEKKQH